LAITLDRIDRRIVALLIKDGRISSAEIRRRIGDGISERSIRHRIDRLQRTGIMRVSAIVNPHALGYEVIGDVIIEVAPGKLRPVAEELAAFDNVSYVAAAAGQGDLSIQVYAVDNQELVRFVDEVVGQLDGVTRTRVVLVPWKLKDVYEWHVPESRDQDPRAGR
jgi:Lrp/AsnC family transcriptional regulator for asnA, asnC and gidA